MKRRVKFVAAAAAAALAGCTQFDVFEDVGSDPHPPVVSVYTIELFVPEEPAPPPPPPPTAPAGARVISWDSGGFTVRRGQKFVIGREFSDVGGDVMRFRVRDRNGSLSAEITPPNDLLYYPGTSGRYLGPADGLEITGMFGPHVLEVWAEDSHESRSEKVEVVVTFAPP